MFRVIVLGGIALSAAECVAAVGCGGSLGGDDAGQDGQFAREGASVAPALDAGHDTADATDASGGGRFPDEGTDSNTNGVFDVSSDANQGGRFPDEGPDINTYDMFDVSSDTPEGGRFPDEGTDSNTNDVFDAFPQEGPMLIPDSGLEAGHD